MCCPPAGRPTFSLPAPTRLLQRAHQRPAIRCCTAPHLCTPPACNPLRTRSWEPECTLLALAYEHTIELCRTRPAFERFASLSIADSVAGEESSGSTSGLEGVVVLIWLVECAVRSGVVGALLSIADSMAA